MRRTCATIWHEMEKWLPRDIMESVRGGRRTRRLQCLCLPACLGVACACCHSFCACGMEAVDSAGTLIHACLRCGHTHNQTLMATAVYDLETGKVDFFGLHS